MIDVLIPYHNGAAYIADTLASIQAQTCRDFRVFVYDDGSTADEKQILCDALKVLKGVRYSAVFLPRAGMVPNWNWCLGFATTAPTLIPERYDGSDWIKFVHQDDLLEPTCLERMAGSKAEIIACKRDILIANDVNPDSAARFLQEVAKHTIERAYDSFDFAARVVQNPGHNQIGEPVAVMFRRRCIGRYGVFNTRLKQVADWEYFARIACNEGIDFIGEPLAMFRLHKGGASASATGLDREAAVLLQEFANNDHYRLVREAANRLGINLLQWARVTAQGVD